MYNHVQRCMHVLRTHKFCEGTVHKFLWCHFATMCGNVNSSSATVQYKCGNNVQNRNRHANGLNGRTHVVRVRAISAVNYPIIKHHVCMHVKRCNSNTCKCTAANSKKKQQQKRNLSVAVILWYAQFGFISRENWLPKKQERLSTVLFVALSCGQMNFANLQVWPRVQFGCEVVQ